MRLSCGFWRGLWPSILEGGVAGHVGEQVLAHRLELVPDEVEAEQKDAEVVLGAGRVEGPLPARRRAAVQGLGGEGEAERDVRADLARVERRLEPAELDRAAVPDVVQVHAVVAGRAVVLRLRVVVAVPDAVELVLGLRALPLDAADEVVVDRAGEAAQALLADAEGVQDERFLFVDDLGEVAETASVEGRGVDVDVHAALRVHARAAPADGADDLLELLQVVVAQDRGHDLGAQVEGHVAERRVGDHLPPPPMQVDDLPGIVATGLADVPHRAADHRVDGVGHLFPRPLDRFNLDPEPYLAHVHVRCVPSCVPASTRGRLLPPSCVHMNAWFRAGSQEKEHTGFVVNYCHKMGCIL